MIVRPRPTVPNPNPRSSTVPALRWCPSRGRGSWVTLSDVPGWRQLAAELSWDDGARTTAFQVDGGATVFVGWPFAPLVPRQRGTMRVRVQGVDGWSGWSAPQPVIASFLGAGSLDAVPVPTTAWADAISAASAAAEPSYSARCSSPALRIPSTASRRLEAGLRSIISRTCSRRRIWPSVSLWWCSKASLSSSDAAAACSLGENVLLLRSTCP